MPEEKELVITATRSEYKGHPMIVLTSGTNEKYPFQFGLQKARRIVAAIDAIKQFVIDAEKLEALKPVKDDTKTVSVK